MQIFKILLIPVFAFLLAIASAQASGAMLRGDWHSAGGPQMPWNPTYPFQYDCQAEITDHVERTSEGGQVPAGKHYRLFAVHKFQFDRKRQGFSGGDNWVYIADVLDADTLEGRLVELKQAPRGAFVPESVGSSIHFSPGRKPAPDEVTISAHMKLSFGNGYSLSRYARETFPRTSSSLQVRTEAYLNREEGAPEIPAFQQHRTLQVICDKVK